MTDPAAAADFIGSWRLVACETRLADGQVVRPFGDSPEGVIMYGADGRMSVHLLRGGEEAPSAPDGYTGYFGRYSVERGRAVVVHHLEGSSDPRIEGDQVRGYRFEADRLILSGAFEGTQSELVWQRLR